MKHVILIYFFSSFAIISMTGSRNMHDKDISGKYFTNSNTLVNCQYEADHRTGDLLLHEIPVLCYHQVREWTAADSKNARIYIMPSDRFNKQIKMLADSGYHVILPGELIDYLNKGIKLPSRPVVLTFDDGTASQFLNAVPVLNKYNFKGVFFIMTVSLNHSIYMSNQQVKLLSDGGHIIGCHTWDHHNVTGYKEEDWKVQIGNPTDQLQKITGRPVKYFAYPNGLWNEKAVEELKNYGFAAAFQLIGKQSITDPVFTIRRIIVDGNWTEKQLFSAIKNSFK